MDNNGNGTDDFGFSGLPGGSRCGLGYFTNIGLNGFWWSATEDSTTNAWMRFLDYSLDEFHRLYYPEEYGMSVRCVRDQVK